MNKVKVYGKDGCPKCFYIETKAKQNENCELEIIHEVNKVKNVIEKNNLSNELPIVDINGKIMQFSEARKWFENNK